MYTCPACGNEDVINRTTCPCGADLTLLLRLDSVADAWYNRALAALSAGSPGKALEWFSACCAARPSDAEARLALAHIWCQFERWSEARAAIDSIRQINPDLPGLNDLEKAIADHHQSSVENVWTK